MVFFKNFTQPCKKRDRKATERAILLAASKLFAEKGYENTRTLDIAQVAGANEALIHRYFGGKEGLLTAIIKNEEALEMVIEKKNKFAPSHMEDFPEYGETKSLKKGVQLFFEMGLKAIEAKVEFMKIGSSRSLVDPEMASAIKHIIIDRHVPIVAKGLRTYPEIKGKTKAEIDALALFLLATNFNMNFHNRKVYLMDPKQVDFALKIATDSLVEHYTK